MRVQRYKNPKSFPIINFDYDENITINDLKHKYEPYYQMPKR